MTRTALVPVLDVRQLNVALQLDALCKQLLTEFALKRGLFGALLLVLSVAGFRRQNRFGGLQQQFDSIRPCTVRMETICQGGNAVEVPPIETLNDIDIANGVETLNGRGRAL